MSWWRNIELSQEQLNKIEDVYLEVLDAEDPYGVAGGAHYLLLHTLNRCGIRTNSTAEAKKIAYDLLYGGDEDYGDTE
jgi:hypothetical protein